MLTNNIDNLIGNLLDGGFKLSVRDAYAAADYLLKETAAQSVAIAAEINGSSVDLAIALKPHEGYYAFIQN